MWHFIKILRNFFYTSALLNPFSTNVPLLYPLKTSENLRWFSDVFRGYRSWTLTENGLNSQSAGVTNNVVLVVFAGFFSFSFFFFFCFLFIAHCFVHLFHFETFWKVFIKLIKLIAKFLTEPNLFPWGFAPVFENSRGELEFIA